jgi:hypothetical protein
LEVLREHCQAIGRPYEQLEKTLVYYLHITLEGLDGTHSPQAAIDTLADLAAEGFDHVILGNITDPKTFDLLATRIIPAIEGVAVSGR